jgi:hypothetical protein
MILGGSCYAELPISSTRHMFQTYNGEVYDLDMCLEQELDIGLKIKEFELGMTIIHIDLNVKNVADITLIRSYEA